MSSFPLFRLSDGEQLKKSDDCRLVNRGRRLWMSLSWVMYESTLHATEQYRYESCRLLTHVSHALPSPFDGRG